MIKYFISILICYQFVAPDALGRDKEALPIPRFVTIKAGEANVRTGPNVRYPIRVTFVKKGEPVEIIAEYEHWRRIRDIDAEEGWVHETMLSGKRAVIILGDKPQLLYKKANTNSASIVLVEPQLRTNLLKCRDKWCEVSIQDYKGWIERQHLWGVYNHEEVN